MKAKACLLAALMAALAFPGVHAQAGPQVTDPADDARENDSSATAALAQRTACRAGGVLTSPACGAPAPAPAAGGEPAPRTMEAISATLRDDAEALHVTLELAEVAEDFAGAVRLDGSAGAIYMVCWTTSGAACSETVTLAAMPSAGEVALTPIFQVRDGACNDYGRCTWRVETTLEPGAPGRITWHVPRDLLPNGTEGTVLETPEIRVLRYYSPSGRIVWPMEDGVGYSLRAPGDAATSGYAANHYIPVDGSEPGTAYRILTPAAPPRLDATFDELLDRPGDVVGGARPDLDILALRLAETDTTFTVAVQVAAVDTRPQDHELLAAFDLASGRYVSWGYSARGGTLAPNAEVCTTPGCLQEEVPNLRSVPINVTVQPGAPGWINATFARGVLGAPERGSLVGSIDVTLFTYDGRTTREADTPAARGQLLVSGATDTLAYAPPWRFQLDSLHTMSSTGVFVEDAIGDVESPPDVASNDGRFDIAYVEATGIEPGLSRFTLGIADLSSIDVPARYRGFVYAVALETEGGNFMVGFLRTARPGGTDQEFFCGEDVVLFAAQPRDPDTIIRRTITGLISRAPGAAAGSSQRGSLVFEVPHDCFGGVGLGPVQVKRLSAGSFLLPLAVQLPPAPLDTVLREDPFELHAAAVAVPAPPWYVAPFGIEGFWDILGIASAVGASGVGVVAVRRKRRLVARYLARVETVIVEHESNAQAQERALLGLRNELKQALISGRIEHAHYAIIDHRLDEALSKARVRALGAAFDELPNRMLRRLQDLLVDGQMSREDYRVFCLMLEESALNEAGKDRIRHKLEAWVRQDASEPVRTPPP